MVLIILLCHIFAVAPLIVLDIYMGGDLTVSTIIAFMSLYWFFMLIPSWDGCFHDGLDDIRRIIRGTIRKTIVFAPVVCGITYLVTRNTGHTVFAAIMVATIALTITFRLVFMAGEDISMPRGDWMMFND